MHANHAKVELVVLGDSALCHKRSDHGDLRYTRKLNGLFGGSRDANAAAHIHYRALGLLDGFDRSANLLGIATVGRTIGRDVHIVRIIKDYFLACKI